MTRQILPHEIPLIIKKLSGYEKYLTLIYDKIESDECQRAEPDGKNVGYYMLDNKELQEFFKPIFEELKINPKITSGYIHYTMKNGSFGTHIHDLPHAVYYIQAPQNSGQLIFPDHAFQNTPQPFQFFIIPRNTMHEIGLHKNEVYRVAITIEMEMEDY